METLCNIRFANPPKFFGGGDFSTSYLANNQHFKTTRSTILQSPSISVASAPDAVPVAIRCGDNPLCTETNLQTFKFQITKQYEQLN